MKHSEKNSSIEQQVVFAVSFAVSAISRLKACSHEPPDSVESYLTFRRIREGIFDPPARLFHREIGFSPFPRLLLLFVPLLRATNLEKVKSGVDTLGMRMFAFFTNLPILSE